LMSLAAAARLSPTPLVRFAALIHDLGKGLTPEAEWPRHIAHEVRSLPLVESLCDRLGAPKEFRELSMKVAEFHTHAHRAFELRPTTLLQLLKQLDAFRRPQRWEDFILCCEADSRGRTGFEDRDYPQSNYLR